MRHRCAILMPLFHSLIYHGQSLRSLCPVLKPLWILLLANSSRACPFLLRRVLGRVSQDARHSQVEVLAMPKGGRKASANLRHSRLDVLRQNVCGRILGETQSPFWLAEMYGGTVPRLLIKTHHMPTQSPCELTRKTGHSDGWTSAAQQFPAPAANREATAMSS